ncbi:MAG: hypothetical protein RMJ35_02290, partial [Phycisphaerales bacterium]|nr:hypothetical protein [Phycisphaerales bacterium]
MAVRFVLGRAGSGKSEWCLARIVDSARADPLGPPILLLVPPQATFTTQRRLACGGELPGFCRIRVLSFDRLAEIILSECGGEAVPMLTPRGRRMILTRLLREFSDQLRVYRDSAGRIGLAEELDATFSELEHHGYGVEHLTNTLEQLAAENPAPQSPAALLLDKLRDVRLLYDAYQAFLGQDRVDPHRRLQQLLAALRTPGVLKSSSVFIDGFLDFSEVERQLIATLAAVCSDVTITLLLNPAAPVVDSPDLLPDETGLFHRTEMAWRRLRLALRREGIEPVELVKLPDRARPALFEAIERALEGREPAASESGEHGVVTMLQLPDRRAEVDAAAATIRSWLRQGLRARDVAVLCRTPADYDDLIEAAFSEYQIPFFADRRRPAVHHPLLATIRAMLTAARGDCPHEAMMTLAKGGLFPLHRFEADRLENYVLEHSLSGKDWFSTEPWRFAARQSDEEAEPAPPDDCDELRLRLIAPLKPLLELCSTQDAAPLRRYASALMESLRLADTPRRLAGWIEQDEEADEYESAAEHQQVWAQWIELLDELVDLLGEESVRPSEFAELIESSLSGFDLAIAPATLEQVLVGDFQRTRFVRCRGVVLLGFADGMFPRIPVEGSVFGDRERRDLERRKLELESNTQRAMFRESLLAYLAVSRATERICITRPLTDDAGR